MAYVDYEFYKSEYYGDTIPEESFPKFASIASDRIDQITFDRLIEGLPENERDKIKVQKAVCAVADAIYNIDKIKKSSMESVGTITREDGTVIGKAVSSVSSGSESVSYVTGTSGSNTDIYAQASTDKKTESLLLRNVAADYLSGITNKKGICLLYAGL